CARHEWGSYFDYW
nr:immunoglobulin heavy chain junction region [Mus musculus]